MNRSERQGLQYIEELKSSQLSSVYYLYRFIYLTPETKAVLLMAFVTCTSRVDFQAPPHFLYAIQPQTFFLLQINSRSLFFLKNMQLLSIIILIFFYFYKYC